MKTAKKVLSVLLAVMLILGTVTVAASAFSDNAKVTWTLKAEVFASSVDANDDTKTAATEVVDAGMEDTYKTGSAANTLQKADVTAYKKVKNHAYQDNSDVIEVKAGDVVWVTVGFATEGELYPDMFENVLYYSSGLFYSTTQASNFFVKLNGDWNSYNFTWTVTPFSKANATKRTQWTKGTTGYHAYFMNSYTASITDYEEALFADIDEDIIAIPVYVNPNATAGTTGSIAIVLPNAFVPGVEAVEDGDVYGNFEKVQGTDYHTGDVLNFKVVGNTPSLNYDNLNTAIAAYETKAADGKTYTTDTWAAATEAYNAANAAKTDATTQDAIDTATTNLNTALNALEEAVALDYARINAALALADETNTANATVSTKGTFDDAVEAALTAVSTATTQDALDTAAAALEDAIDGLKDKADMTAIYDALAYADGLDKGDWADETFDELEELIAAAQAILAQADDFDDQAAVAAAAQAIYDMQITVECADYNEVWDLMDEASFLNENNYTTASWAALETALGAVVPSLGKSQQATVDGFAAAISEALDGLKEKIDTAGLAAAVSLADGENKDDYTTQDWMQLQVYVNAAKNDYIGKEADYAADDKQAEVDQLANDIYDILAKKLGDADYSAVEAALAKIPEDDILAGVYTDESVAALDEIAESLVWGLKEDKQAQVDKMAQDLETAIAGLELKKADYDMVDKYLAQAANIDRDLYTAASLDVLDAAVKAVVKDLDIKHQDEVTGMANDLYAALEGLEYAGADFSAIDEIAENAGDLAREFYTDDSLAAYDAAVADAIAIYNNKAAYTIADQATINAAAAKGADAGSLLVAKDADFSAIDALVARAYDLDPSIYTEDSWNAFNAAFDGTLYVYNNKANYDIFDQGHIDVKAEDGEAAFDLLVLADADYSEVETWANKVSDDKADNYTKATWDAYKQAIDDVTYGLKADKQDDVDDMAAAILAAYRGLKAAGDANYSAVDAAIIAYTQLDESKYTPESYAAVTAAVGAVKAGLNENHQDEVDAMADAINTAIANLKDAEVTPPTPAEGRVTNVEYTMTAAAAKTYDVTVEGRAAKIQFVDANGNTVTISRTGGKATIVSYDKDGNVVDDMSRDLAYEVWTTEQTIKAGAYKVIAKDATDGWEALDLGYALNVVNSTKNADVISITPAASSAKIGDALNVQVVTGVDAVKIQILVDDATAGDVTFSARSYGKVEGDTCTYNAFVKLYKPGTHTLTVLVKTADGWATQRSTVSVDVTGTVTAVATEIVEK